MTKRSLARYDSYKDSGVDWLGKVPANWNVVRNKEIFKERNSLSVTGEEMLLTVSHITGVTPRSEKNVNMFLAESNEGYKICSKGDLVINTMWAWMGALGTSNHFGICSPAYNVYMPNKNIPYCHRYFDYLYRIPNSVVEMTRNSKGIVSSRLRLYAKDFFQISTVLPDFEEQQAIADYLDAQTAQIDRKVDLLSQKAEKYASLKQALINETVTRGLDKSAPMKDSGVEWVGQVPVDWEISAVTNITEIVSIKNHPDEELLSVYRDYGVIIKSDRDDNNNKPSENLAGYKLVEPGFLVINKMKAWQGSLGVSRYRGIVSPAYITCKVNKKIERRYLHHLLRCRTYINEYNRLSYGVRNDQWDMRYDDFKYIPVLIPSLDEQTRIADYLDGNFSQIERIIETIYAEIEKLAELRKTLINDVVTGKIKVSG